MLKIHTRLLLLNAKNIDGETAEQEDLSIIIDT